MSAERSVSSSPDSYERLAEAFGNAERQADALVIELRKANQYMRDEGTQNVLTVKPYLATTLRGDWGGLLCLLRGGHQWQSVYPDQRFCYRCGRMQEWRETL